jgi:hypothetical protein
MIDLEEKGIAVPRAVAVWSLKEDMGNSFSQESIGLLGERTSQPRDQDTAITDSRWSTALMGVAWIHLVCFWGCHAIYDPSITTDVRHPLIWLLELVANMVFLGSVLGRGWIRSSHAVNLVAKLGFSFLILSFNLVTLNSFTGFELSWYKPALATLSTFLFATLAWLLTPWLFVPAIQMWLTGLLMVKNPGWAYLIYGWSWWLALTGIAVSLRRRRRTRRA